MSFVVMKSEDLIRECVRALKALDEWRHRKRLELAERHIRRWGWLYVITGCGKQSAEAIAAQYERSGPWGEAGSINIAGWRQKATAEELLLAAQLCPEVHVDTADLMTLRYG